MLYSQEDAARGRVIIVAELGAAHGGVKDVAIRLIRAARDVGADAVKFQTYLPEDLAAPTSPIIRTGPWAGWHPLDLYRAAHTPWEWHADLFAEAAACGLRAFSSPFSPDAVRFLELFAPCAYKIAALEDSYGDLVAAAAATGRQLVQSVNRRRVPTGAAILLHCVSAYPAAFAQMALGTIRTLYGFAPYIGLSDHSVGSDAGMVAVALGAQVLEKHIRQEDVGSVDDAFASTVDEFAAYVERVRDTERAVAVRNVWPLPGEASAVALRRRPIDGHWRRA